jgi:HEAT repeat protein
VRERAAIALGRRKELPIDALVALLQSPALEARYGACDALGRLGARGAPAVDALLGCLSHEDIWLRIQAGQALAGIGAPAMKAVPRLLELVAWEDRAKDPRNMHQRYLSNVLFDRRRGLLGRSLEGVDRQALHKAVRAGLLNQDGHSRSSFVSVYDNLSYEEIKPLLPAILEAVKVPAPSGEMFADGIRLGGCQLLSKHLLQEGIPVIVQYAREQNPWASEHRTPEIMKLLLPYGTHARVLIPELEKLANYFEKDELDFPKHLMLQKAQCVRETIEAIRAATETPVLQRIR